MFLEISLCFIITSRISVGVMTSCFGCFPGFITSVTILGNILSDTFTSSASCKFLMWCSCSPISLLYISFLVPIAYSCILQLITGSYSILLVPIAYSCFLSLFPRACSLFVLPIAYSPFISLILGSCTLFLVSIAYSWFA